MNRTLFVAAIAAFGVAPAFAIFDGSNLIKNSGAEDGPVSPTNGGAVASIPEWSIDTIFGVAAYSNSWYEQPGNPANTQQGEKFFNGASQSGAATVRIRQTLDVSSQAASIDALKVNYTLSGWFGGWRGQEDTAGLTAIFKGADQSALSSITIGNPTAADRGGEAKTLFYSGGSYIPAGTRSVEFILAISKAAGGSSNDGAADNLNFSADVVPEPASVTVLALGALAAMRRRRAR